jgi:hydrogenase assembly chaperone HypC/HupF
MTLDAARCITCGDVAVAATVVEIAGNTATVHVAGEREQVGIELVERVALGDVLLCHAGIALEKLDRVP